MPAASIGPLSEYPSSSLMLKSVPSYGASIRKKKPGTSNPSLPTRLFLVYVKDVLGKLVVRYLEGPLGSDKIEDAELKFYTRAQNGEGDTSPFERIIFRRPSYFTIVLDQPGWRFYFPLPDKPDVVWPGGELHDPIVFLNGKSAVDDSGVYKYQPSDENYAFYDCKSVTIGRPAMQAIRCVNYFTKNEAGDILQSDDPPQLFFFNIFLRIPISADGGDQLITVILDPDGQNQGPDKGGDL